ncbi:hypothetical protein MP638_004761 [Amoeboaphelidium occidentale]|nr:hypothetical protein MP638_004761 [Amoeboaphelidium occidentale]
MTNTPSSSSSSEEVEEDSFGKYIYNQMKNISSLLSIERLLPSSSSSSSSEDKEDKERVIITQSNRRVVKFLGTSTSDIEQVKATTTTTERGEYLPFNLQQELQSELLLKASMEDVLPLETWKRMKPKERHYFLDSFYSLKEKYTMERESDEDCSTEELGYFQCSTSSSSSSSSTSVSEFFRNPNNSSWKERLDKCYRQKKELQNCRELMTVKSPMFRKTQKVFGKENGLYLRVVKEEIEQNK